MAKKPEKPPLALFKNPLPFVLALSLSVFASFKVSQSEPVDEIKKV